MEGSISFDVVVFLGLIMCCCCSPIFEDKQALIDFVNNFSHTRPLNWSEGLNVCDGWEGVSCSDDGSRVMAVRLGGVGFSGPIPANTLSRLSGLQFLSLSLNNISGSFPYDELGKLGNLSVLQLDFNRLSGALPSNFSIWSNLTVIDLSHNGFNGSIPSSISNLTRLTSLNLANNSLSGEIPDLQLPNLRQLNLANNSLTGIVPKSLQRFPASTTFYGNNVSAFLHVHSPSPSGPSPSPSPSPRRSSKRGRKLGGHALMGIIIGACVAAILGILLLLLLLMLCCWKRNGKTVLSRKLVRTPEKGVSRGRDGTKLVFLDGCCYSFDLEDLLRASAEVLGKGTFGTTYKAVLEDVTSVVVKRLKEVNVGRREFEQQMELVGRIRHENVVELRAFYYSKDEKLMIYDYYTQGSVSALLHGRQVESRITLDWDTRLKIAIGAARGIACIHTQNGGKLVHGNIKASNIFLNPANYGCVSDLGLTTTLMNPPGVRQISRVAGYRAPEVVDARKTSQQSDVYSLGVLLLELLTGKSPVNATGSDEVVNLVRWVQSVVREEWTAEVFDVELMRYPNIEEEMVEMLQIALACVVRMPEQRPKMSDVVKMLEEIRRLEAGIHPHSTSKSGGSTPSPLAIKPQSSSSPKAER
ncbi:hypothetical protein Syun_005633 [Stephania yunnanensis]|uniref:Protein kinase domain-containing protein n=1 Tax=Stephania yunnanensis TaxID=152371 RepID=A0AAP0L5J1_9MAGN